MATISGQPPAAQIRPPAIWRATPFHCPSCGPDAQTARESDRLPRRCSPPNSKHPALVTLAKRGKANKAKVADGPPTSSERRAFNIDIETCQACGGEVSIVACIEDPVVLQNILDHLKKNSESHEYAALPKSRASPGSEQAAWSNCRQKTIGLIQDVARCGAEMACSAHSTHGWIFADHRVLQAGFEAVSRLTGRCGCLMTGKIIG